MRRGTTDTLSDRQFVTSRRKEELCHRQKERVMLVLSRKKTESIFINDNIVVTVLSILGNKVRLGIEASREVPVHRSEIREAIKNRDVPAINPCIASSP